MRDVQSGMIAGVMLLVASSTSQAEDSVPHFSGDRILVNATINEQPARFLFDTGASFSALFGSTAKRLDLEIESTKELRIGGHPVQTGLSTPFDLAMFGHKAHVPMPVLPFSSGGGLDGVFSWRNLTGDALLIDGYERRVSTVRTIPTREWQRWSLDRESQQLFFTVTKDGRPWGRVFVDTGMACGVRLSPPLWKEWREKHPDKRVTLETFRYAVGDTMVHEMGWAETYALGDLTLHQVDIGPIPEAAADRVIDAAGRGYHATIGMRALRHLRMIINPKDNEVLTQSVSPVPDHNRLGAVFVRSPGDTPTWVAKVLPSSPAAEAGLLNGDVLMRLNGTDYSAEKDPPGESPNRYGALPVGTELRLQVSRAGSTHEISVTLENLLP